MLYETFYYDYATLRDVFYPVIDDAVFFVAVLTSHVTSHQFDDYVVNQR